MKRYTKQSLGVLLSAFLLVGLLISAGIFSGLANSGNRLTEEHLAAYYNFEDSGNIGKDVSGNENHLATKWGYAPTPRDSDSGDLNLGQSVGFDQRPDHRGVLTVSDATFNQADFLDMMDVYTLSMFFKNTSVCDGGYIFSNKFWGEDGIQVSVNKWSDPSATGQVELWLTYRYIDASDNAYNYNKCVKFMPEAPGGGVDTSWHNFVLVVDKPNHTVRFYYDGKLVDENSNMKTLVSECVQYPIAFGAMLDPQWPSAERAYDGELDEIRIYDFAATDAEAAILAANMMDVEEDDWAIGNEPVLDKYDLYTSMLPLWEGDTVYNESVLVLKDQSGNMPEKSLLYPATEIISVRSQDLKTEYDEGDDWILQDGKLVFPAGSSIPSMEYSEYYPETWSEGSTFNKVGGGYIYYSEEFQKRQIAVTYKHTGTWTGDLQPYEGFNLSNTMAKLNAKEELNIVFYGDSITQGFGASGFNGFKPFAESWAQMLNRMLRAQYEYSNINAINSALASTDTAWGVDDANLTPRVIDKNPDLVIIAFGMNDGDRSPGDYRNNIKGMIEKVRLVHPDTEFLLVSPMLPNRQVDWLATGNQDLYQDELLALQSEFSGVAVARVTDAFNYILSNKTYGDITGNNVNHPNDFSMRIYAQVAFAALNSLNSPADTSELMQLIREAQKKDGSMYTADSWQSLTDAVTQAQALLFSSDQNAIDQGAQALRDAIDRLEDVPSRLSLENLIAYYSFEYDKDLGYDTSGNENHLETGMWGNPAISSPSGGILKGGKGVFLDGHAVMVPRVRAANQPDYLDIADSYSISLFFRMDTAITNGAVFSNKNWAGEGIRVMANKWIDPEAAGQVELFFDYQYLSEENTLVSYRKLVKFIPEAEGGGIDTSWHHIVISVNKRDDKVSFYIDGEAVDVMPSQPMKKLIVNCSKYTMAFGGQWDDDYQNAQGVFKGWLDEIRVYDYAVNTTEARMLYQNENLPTPPPKDDDEEEESNNNLILNATTASGIHVQLTIPKEAVPESVSMEADDLTSGADYEAIRNVIGDKEYAACFSIKLYDEDEPITSLNDYADILLSGFDVKEGHEVYWLNAQGQLVPMNGFVNGEGKMEFFIKETGSFVVWDMLSDTDSPDTGETGSKLLISIITILLSVFAAALVISRRKENRHSAVFR